MPCREYGMSFVRDTSTRMPGLEYFSMVIGVYEHLSRSSFSASTHL